MLTTLTLPAAPSLEALRTRRIRVRSADELRRALREARDRPLALDASALDCVLRTDDERSLLEVQGAMTWRALAVHLGAAGERLSAWAGCGGVPASVGQAISADAAGPDGAPLSACVESIALVTVDGELRRVDRNTPARLFHLVVGGQGVFGLIYSVTLRIDALLQATEHAVPAIELELPGPELGSGIEVQSLLPPDQVEGFLADARELAAERRLALRRIAVRPLQAGAESALGWAKRAWASVTLHLQLRATLGASVHAAEIRRLVHAAAIARGGSFPVSAAPEVSRAQLDACYPELPAFLAEKRRYDPAERLQNTWYRCVTAQLRHQACESRWGN